MDNDNHVSHVRASTVSARQNMKLTKQTRLNISLAIVGMSWVVTVGLFWDTAMSMVEVWANSRTFALGFVILPISLYVMWVRRYRIAEISPVPNLWGFLILAGLAVGWLLGWLMDVRVVQQFALVCMLPGITLTVLGPRIVRALLFPLTYLFFAVPVGKELIPPLQDFTAMFAVQALEFTGVPVLQEGRLLTIPNGTWHVAEACAGVRYLISSLTLSFLFAGMIYRSWTRRALFMVAAIVMPIVANGFRAYGTLLLAYVSNNKIAMGIEHFIGGWLFFALVMFVLFSLGLLWREPDAPVSDTSNQSSLPPNLSGIAVGRVSDRSDCSLSFIVLTAISGIILLALAPLLAQRISSGSTVSSATLTTLPSTAPPVTLPWEVMPEYVDKWKPQFHGADTELTQSYRHGAQWVHLYLAYYANPRQGAELISRMNTLVDGKYWTLMAEGDREVVVDGQSLQVHVSHIRSGHRSRMVWSWYWVAGEFTSNPYLVKLIQGKVRFLNEPQGGGVIAIATDYDGLSDDAVKTLEDFLKHATVASTFHNFLPR